MRVVPGRTAEMIEFFEQRAPGWAAAPEVFGLPPQLAASLVAAVADARAKYEAAQQARTHARSATLLQNRAVSELDALGGQLVSIVRAFAIAMDDPSIFSEAQLPAPRAPRPIHPDAPRNITFRLDPVGALEVRWKSAARSPAESPLRGVVYEVWRSLTTDAGDLPLERIGTASSKRFGDITIPAEARRATYVIAAVKGTEVARSAPAVMNFVYSLDDHSAAARRAA